MVRPHSRAPRPGVPPPPQACRSSLLYRCLPCMALCSSAAAPAAAYSDPSETFMDRSLFSVLWNNRRSDTYEVSFLSLVVCSERLIAVIVTSVILGESSGVLALCRPGDAAWSVGTNEHYRWLKDIAFFRGKLYAIRFYDQQQDLIAFEIVDENGNDELRVSRIERRLIGVPWISEYSYLLESQGRLLMICRKIDSRPLGGNRVAVSSKFEVFEANFGRMLWTEVRSLGDELALFVGRGCSRAVSVSPYDLSRDSIFFVDDYVGSFWEKTTTSCGVYDMKDRKVYSTLPMVSWMSGNIPATWLFCEESTTNGLQLNGEPLQEPVETDKEDHGTLLPGGTAGSSVASTTSC